MNIYYSEKSKFDKYGTPESSSYLITFENIAISINIPYSGENTEIKIGPRDWYISDKSLSYSTSHVSVLMNNVPHNYYKDIILKLFNQKFS